MAIIGGINYDERGIVQNIRAMRMQTKLMSITNENVIGFDKIGYQGNGEKKASEALKNAGIKLNKENKTDALFFMSRKQAKKLAELISTDEKDKNAYKAALSEYPSIDIALFGRMVASDPSLNYDAAAQVAHSISTHEVTNYK